MSYLYLSTLFDKIYGISFWCEILCFLLLIGALLLVSFNMEGGFYDRSDLKFAIKVLKIAVTVFLINSTILVVTPDKKETLLIFGVGTTIDCVNNNKQIPKDCVDACNLYYKEFKNHNKTSVIQE
jgi:hypothetical protein